MVQVMVLSGGEAMWFMIEGRRHDFTALGLLFGGLTPWVQGLGFIKVWGFRDMLYAMSPALGWPL